MVMEIDSLETEYRNFDYNSLNEEDEEDLDFPKLSLRKVYSSL